MGNKFFTLAKAMAMAALLVPATGVAGDEGTQPAIDLSPEVMALLRAEMTELAGGIQGIPLAIATADWGVIQEISEKMHGSYIMKSSLTKPQGAELKSKLPHEFKKLDVAFHAKAKKLGQAAASKDPELVVFRYSRVVEACAGCHSKFATSRFAGFKNGSEDEHKH